MTLSFLIALLVALALGGKVIAVLAARKARQPISGDAPTTHQAKQGTPTMGGILIIGAAAAATIITVIIAGDRLLLTAKQNLLLVLGVLIAAGVVGLLDDLGKARKKLNKAGLSERAKLGLQVAVAAGFVLALASMEQLGRVTTSLTIGRHDFDLGLFYYPLALLYLCVFGNAVNFTDGLDGLASGVTLIAAVALGSAVGIFGAEMGIFYGALAGACAGFLWFNAHPARVFMGDTGSLAIGMSLAAAAIIAKQEILFLIVGLVYLAEIASMMIQRYVFKYRRIRRGLEYAQANRVFRRAPLHHHFEELGWPETHVVARFWMLGLAAAALGLMVSRYFMAVPVSIDRFAP